MKPKQTLLILFIFLFSFNLFSQETWIFDRSVYVASSSPTMGETYYYPFYIGFYSSDTIINAITYKKLCSDSLCYQFLYGVRSDNHKIYIAYDIDSNGTDEEYLAYDFNANVGDTLQNVITTYNNYIFITTTFYVAEKCFVQINSDMHRSITVYDIENAPGTPINFIEGIGTASGPGILANYVFLSGAMSLYCFSNNDSTLSNIYDMQICSSASPLYMVDGNNCLSVINGIDDFSSLDFDFSIYPNPATINITIESTKHQVQSIRIMDVLGRDVFESTKNDVLSTKNIDVSQLPSGIYILQMQSKNGVVSKKFVKE